jgi:oligo-1,6-glucosidase
MYQQVKNKGGDLRAFLDAQKISARDNGRTPFQWDASPNAGFTGGEPWLKVNPDYISVNAAAQENDPNSVLNYFRKLVSIRKSKLALVYGEYQLLDKDNPDVYSYLRILGDERYLILLNFKAVTITNINNNGLDIDTVIAQNYPDPPKPDMLRPYEAVVYKLKSK